MKKLLLKWFMPKPAVLVKTAAKAAADFVNNTGKEQAIQTFFEKTETLRKAQMLVSKWLADGKIDESEIAELEAALTPIAQALYDKVIQKIGE